MHKMNRISRGTLAAILLFYQNTFGASALQAADWSGNLSQDVPRLEQFIKTAKGMGDLEKKTGPRLNKLRFFVILTDSNEDYINNLTQVIRSKTNYKVRLEPMNQEQPDKYYSLILEPPD